MLLSYVPFIFWGLKGGYTGCVQMRQLPQKLGDAIVHTGVKMIVNFGEFAKRRMNWYLP